MSIIIQDQPIDLSIVKRNYQNSRKILERIGIKTRYRSLQSDDYEDNKAGWISKAKGEIIASRLTFKNFFNDDHSSIVYTGTWSQETVSVLYGTTRTVSSTVGDYFEITFTGAAIGLVFEKATNLGKIKISLDGVELETVDLYSTTLLSRSIVWKKTDMANGPHTLKVEVETKNASSSANNVGMQGYTLFPHEGIKIEQLSCDLYAYAVNMLTDGNGYKKTTISTPSGYVAYCIVGMRLDEAVMSDATLTDPITCWQTTQLYLYNGAAATTYVVVITLLISKI